MSGADVEASGRAAGLDRVPADVFLLMGQSNMAGRGVLQAGDEEPVAGVRILDGQCRVDDPRPVSPIEWRPGAHPVHRNEPHKNQFGLGIDFARRWRETTGAAEVGLIPCAWGGQPIRALAAGSPLYENALARARTAAEKDRIVGILWHQGESDTATAASAAAYRDALEGFVASIRSDLGGDPAIALGDLAPTLGSGRDAEGRAAVASVRATLRAVAESTPRAGWVSSASLATAEDGTHFVRAALREFGRRYADTLAAVTGRAP